MPVYLILTNENIFSKEYVYPSPYRKKYHPHRSRRSFSIRKEVWEWARENNIKMKKVKRLPLDFKFRQDATRLVNYRWWEALEFNNEDDAALFKLRWL